MENTVQYSDPQNLINLLNKFKESWINLNAEWAQYMEIRPEYSNIGNEKFPFPQCFNETEGKVKEWTEEFIEEIYRNLDK